MTSSKRHLKPGQARWDYSNQEYKPDFHPFCEPNLFSVLFLACGRPDVTRRSLLATHDAIRLYPGEVEWVFMENGGCDQNYQLFMGFPADRKVVIRQENFGINQGLNQLWAISRGQFCMIHENDWEIREPWDFFSISKEIFTEKGDVGIIQLRAINDPCENWGYGKPEFSPWSSSTEKLNETGIKVFSETTDSGHTYFISVFPNGFNNNPCIMRKRLYWECGPYPEAKVGADPRHGETLYQKRVAATGAAIVHIGRETYFHIGRVPTSA